MKKIFLLLIFFVGIANTQTVLNRNQVPNPDFVVGDNFFTFNAGNDTVTGSGNFGAGANALQNIGSGNHNVSIGNLSLQSNTTGRDNVALGYNALNANLIRNNNIAIGINAAMLSTGSDNTIIGAFAGVSLLAVGSNTVIGSRALQNSQGNTNISIGAGSGNNRNNSTDNFTNCIFIGSSTAETAPLDLSNTLIIGSATVPIADWYYGYRSEFHTSSDGLNFTLHGMGAAINQTDANGGTITIAGGISTGSGNGGDIIFKSSPAASTGTDDNALAEIARFTSAGNFILANPTVPANASATGVKGQIAYDNGFIYVCIATNTWVRSALSTWP